MTITICGRAGESKTCIANLIRHALTRARTHIDMGAIPLIDYEVAWGMLPARIHIRIIEEINAPSEEQTEETDTAA